MLALIICGLILSSAVDVQGGYQYSASINGWLTEKRVQTTWEKALKKCDQEGAILASPINEALLNEMTTLTGESNVSYYIGFNARFDGETFVSVEGVPLEDAPLSDLYDVLDPKGSQCLAMTAGRIHAVPCTQRLAYMCYRKRGTYDRLTECGTYDQEYKLDKTTGSCYKLHVKQTDWSEAYSTCISEGGYLAIIDNPTEAALLAMMPWDKKPAVGLRDWTGFGNWKSLHGELIPGISWYNDTMPANECCDCAILNDLGQLEAFNCDAYYFQSICEKDPSYVKFPHGPL